MAGFIDFLVIWRRWLVPRVDNGVKAEARIPLLCGFEALDGSFDIVVAGEGVTVGEEVGGGGAESVRR
jgi:hypothetical protein